tara:strand:- start:359 stop:541 length:183 start_codon:yes stop_codon:yes gene_type:complete
MFSKVADFIIIVSMLAVFYVFSAIGFASMNTKTSYDVSKYLQKSEKFEEPMVVKVQRDAL